VRRPERGKPTIISGEAALPSRRNLGEPKPYQEFGAATRPVGVAAATIGVICHPRSTFEAVVSRPRPLGLLVAFTSMTALARGFLPPPRPSGARRG
jgi:hypothetical protein